MTPDALAVFRERIRAVTVDEFQDVNLLQRTLLDLWLGERDDVCVVGDDHQAIYSFTGATPRYLLDLPKAVPGSDDRAARGELPLDAADPRAREPARPGARRGREASARRAAGRPRARGARARRAGGDADGRRADPSARSRRASRRERSRSSTARTRARPGTSRRSPRRGSRSRCATAGSSRARRRAACARSSAARARRSSRSRVKEAASREGMLVEPDRQLGEQELVRQADLARLVDLAEEFDDGERTVEEFLADLDGRFGPDAVAAGGVQLLTLHRAKGLEFEAVFLPRVEEKELPIRQAQDGRGDRRGAAPPLRRSHAREAPARPLVVDRGEAEPLPRRARPRRGARRPSAARRAAPARAVAGDARSEGAPRLAVAAREGRRRARVRRLPRFDARGDRRAAARIPCGSGHGARDRAGQARALRRRRARGARNDSRGGIDSRACEAHGIRESAAFVSAVSGVKRIKARSTTEGGSGSTPLRWGRTGPRRRN